MTVTEILFTIFVIVLLLLFFGPSLRDSKGKAPRTHCIGQIQQVALGFILYANDHQERYPWQVPVADGGSLEFQTSPDTFRHFKVASNEMGSPKILACPSDRVKKTQTEWVKVRNTNISYFVGLSASREKPNTIISGDRNITGGTLSNGFLLTINSNSMLWWTKEIHNHQGNIGFSDGSVIQFTRNDLQNFVSNSPTAFQLSVP
jgi:prepilin-type processing-associated H-X9-DG protein